MKTGIIIARFQSPSLHEGHVALIDYVRKANDKVVLFLGNTESRLTTSNPLPFDARMDMVKGIFPDIPIHKLPDTKYDDMWIARLDSMIEKTYPSDDICLYGSRDSFIKYYNGKYRTETFGEIPGVSATKIRSAIHGNIKDNEDWRKGIIYASAHKYPTSYQAVDVAIINFDTNQVLLGKKGGEPKYRFVGGFVDVKDESLELAAKREAREECGDIETDSYKYLGSFRIDDWRYRNSQDKIMSAFFCCHYIYGRVNPQDDISELQWFDLDALDESVFEPEHRILFHALCRHLILKSV